MYVKIFSKAFPNYSGRMDFMSEYAGIWMRTNDCNLELLPKE